jgi:hypothetical protein
MTNVHIHRTPMRVVSYRPHGEPRWCFKCRTRRRFDYVVRDTIEPSYYDPYRCIECGTCGQVDGDLFPGRSREWE